MVSTELLFDVLARDKASKTFDKIDKSASRTRKTLGALGKGIATTAKAVGAIGLAAGAGLTIFAKGAVDEAREAEKVSKTTAQIIKATGGAAKVTAGQVGDLAERLSVKAGVDDELIQTGANLLLTFKNVRNEAGNGAKVFDRATAAAVDLSAAGFGSVEGASKMLGKALNDPVKGITALSRAGVTFTQGQKDQIEAMVEAGDVLGAQKIILKEVESQVGGVAAASATAGEKAKVAFANFQEEIGTRLLPIIDKLADQFVKFLPRVLKFADAVAKKIAPAFQTAGTWVKAFFNGLKGGSAGGSGAIVTITNAAGKLREIFIAAVPVIKSWADRIRDIAVTVGPILLSVLKQTVTVIAAVVTWAIRNRDILIPLAGAILAGVVAWKAYIAVTKGLAAVKKAIAAVRIAFIALNLVMRANPIGIVITVLAALVAGLVIAYKRSETFRRIVNAAWNGIKAVALAVGRWFTNTLWPLLKRVWEGISAGVRIMVTVVKAYFNIWKTAAVTVKNGIVTAFNAVVDFFRKAPGRIASAASGLFDGIKDAFRSAINWIISRWNNLSFGIPGFNPPGPGSFPGVSIGTPNLPLLANGGIVRRAGDAIVGDRGPERLTLPRGARVDPLTGRNAGINVERLEVKAFSDRFSLRQVQDELALQGVT